MNVRSYSDVFFFLAAGHAEDLCECYYYYISGLKHAVAHTDAESLNAAEATVRTATCKL